MSCSCCDRYGLPGTHRLPKSMDQICNCAGAQPVSVLNVPVDFLKTGESATI